VAAFLTVMSLADGVLAESARKCRKACKPAVAECMQLTGQSRKLCRKTLIPTCRRQGLGVCALSTTTTVPTTGTDSTTTTTLAGDGTGGGVMSLNVDEVTRQGEEDPRLFSLTITIGYSVTTADAVTQVALEPSTFAVVDMDTGVAYLAEPASQPGDCAGDVIVAKDGPDVTCTLHFLLPAAVAAPSEVNGGTHAQLQFKSQGLHGSEYWNY
jgi:hypothetical protein